MGIGYLSKPYNEFANPENLSYSTKINFPLLLNLTTYYRVTQKVQLSMSLNYNHVSNAGFSEPNLGINYPSVSLGLEFFPASPEFPCRKPDDWKKSKRKKRFDITIFQGAKQLDHGENLKYLIFGASGLFSTQIGKINALAYGGEWIFDGVIEEKIKRGKIDGSGSQSLNLLAGHEFLLGRFIFSQSIGFYIYKP